MLDISGIGVEVFVWPELKWVDINGEDDEVTEPAAAADQTEMPLVQIPHRRYETDSPPLLANLGYAFPGLGDRPRDSHRFADQS